ncbi:hypothetical protein CDAR_277731 [Caerostris darwini]|uniref:Uncharacterized protein n=1 Tax=Caerostris darwini TaxID=1538125 RepID=A0AAV4V7V4_9ARAC|nr:hypothetical protein CDAR_277731 [Caerostris darwini]
MFVVKFTDPSGEYAAALLRQVIASDNSICFCFSKFCLWPPPPPLQSLPSYQRNKSNFVLFARAIPLRYSPVKTASVCFFGGILEVGVVIAYPFLHFEAFDGAFISNLVFHTSARHRFLILIRISGKIHFETVNCLRYNYRFLF